MFLSWRNKRRQVDSHERTNQIIAIRKLPGDLITAATALKPLWFNQNTVCQRWRKFRYLIDTGYLHPQSIASYLGLIPSRTIWNKLKVRTFS